MQATVKPCLKCPEGTAAGMPIALNMQAPGRGPTSASITS